MARIPPTSTSNSQLPFDDSVGRADAVATPVTAAVSAAAVSVAKPVARWQFGSAAPTNDGFVSAPVMTLKLPFAQGANGGRTAPVDFTRFLSMKDPTESELVAAQPMLIDYLKTGQFGEFKGEGGVPIRYGVYAPPPGTPIKGVINLVGGRAESFSKYAEVLFNFRDLRNQGYVIASMDHRGQGFSGRELDNTHKSHVNQFGDFVKDEKHFTDLLSQWYPNAPRTVLAHSMGGAISTTYLQEHPGEYQRAVLMSPMLDPDTGMPDFVETPLSRAGGALAPKAFVFGQGDYKPWTKDDRLTQSQPRLDVMNNLSEVFPETKLGGVTWGWVNQSVRADRKLMEPAQLDKLKGVDVHLFTARDDHWVQPVAEDEMAKRLELDQKNYVGAQHELVNQPDAIRRQVMSDLRAVLVK